jgi:hypothetical protein
VPTQKQIIEQPIVAPSGSPSATVKPNVQSDNTSTNPAVNNSATTEAAPVAKSALAMAPKTKAQQPTADNEQPESVLAVIAREDDEEERKRLMRSDSFLQPVNTVPQYPTTQGFAAAPSAGFASSDGFSSNRNYSPFSSPAKEVVHERLSELWMINQDAQIEDVYEIHTREVMQASKDQTYRLVISPIMNVFELKANKLSKDGSRLFAMYRKGRFFWYDARANKVYELSPDGTEHPLTNLADPGHTKMILKLSGR